MAPVTRVLFVRNPASSVDTVPVLEDRGYDVATVGNADEALSVLRDLSVDCIVSNHEVPGPTGLEFLGGLRVLRAVREEFESIPFILFTEVENEDIARELFSAEATDYVPIRPGLDSHGRLVERIDAAVGRRRAERRADRLATVNEVIRDVNRELVRAEDRETVARAVCAELTQPGTYRYAMVAAVEEGSVSTHALAANAQEPADPPDDPGYSSLVRTVSNDRRFRVVGFGEEVDDSGRVHGDGPTDGDGPTEGDESAREADTTDDVDHPSAVAAPDAWTDARDRGYQKVAGVPVVYGDHVESVLVLYAGRSDAFDRTERAVVSELGGTIAYALNALRTREALRRQNEQLENFASVVSHDLRGPLNVAQGHFDVLRERMDESLATSEDVEAVAESHTRMVELIDDILTVAREGTAVEDPESCSLAAVARDAWSHVESGDARLEAGDRPVEADRSRLTELFENCFRNAIEHGDARVVRVVGTAAGFAVEDDGTGIARDVRDDVFEMGVTTAETGTGFGLAIVSEIAEAHDWSARLTESDEGGARFEFTW